MLIQIFAEKETSKGGKEAFMGPHWMIVAKYIVVKVCLLSTC
jgi:hypothetical protein